MNGKSWRPRVLVAAAFGLLVVACGGGTQLIEAGDAGGNPDAAQPDAGDGASPDAATATARADVGTEGSNGASTEELRSLLVPMDAVLGELETEEQRAVCEALGAWRYRMYPQWCLTFVQTAVILQERSQQEDRELCTSGLSYCPLRQPASLPCGKLTCSRTLRELDTCLHDDERWYAAVPSCETMTRETAARTMGPDSPSCAAINRECDPW